jgi:hypothetical protein
MSNLRWANLRAIASPPKRIRVDAQRVLPSNRGIAQFAATGNFSILAVAENVVFHSNASGNSWHVISDPNRILPSEELAAVSGLIFLKKTSMQFGAVSTPPVNPILGTNSEVTQSADSSGWSVTALNHPRAWTGLSHLHLDASKALRDWIEPPGRMLVQ